jgi:lysophospholipase L1-like esterase
MRYQRFVALGDSCTEGLDDPYPPGGPQSGVFRGCADLVAARLARDDPGFRYANLGVRGRRLDQIIAEQIPVATALRPDLVALFGGGNDIMTHGWNERTVARRVDHAVGALTALVVWPVVRGRVRNKLIGRQPGDGFLPKRPELLPVSECQAVQGNA